MEAAKGIKVELMFMEVISQLKMEQESETTFML